MKVLYLRGVAGGPGRKADALREEVGPDCDVVAPRLAPLRGRNAWRLPFGGLAAAIKEAQAEFDRVQPDLVVGVSVGGRIAVEMDTGTAQVVLVAPACTALARLLPGFVAANRGDGTRAAVTALPELLVRVRPGTIILHCCDDGVVSIACSRALAARPGVRLVRVPYQASREEDRAPRPAAAHRMNFPRALKALRWVVRVLVRRHEGAGRSGAARTP